jgi:hypothetical protein
MQNEPPRFALAALYSALLARTAANIAKLAVNPALSRKNQ